VGSVTDKANLGHKFFHHLHIVVNNTMVHHDHDITAQHSRSHYVTTPGISL